MQNEGRDHACAQWYVSLRVSIIQLAALAWPADFEKPMTKILFVIVSVADCSMSYAAVYILCIVSELLDYLLDILCLLSLTVNHTDNCRCDIVLNCIPTAACLCAFMPACLPAWCQELPCAAVFRVNLLNSLTAFQICLLPPHGWLCMTTALTCLQIHAAARNDMGDTYYLHHCFPTLSDLWLLSKKTKKSLHVLGATTTYLCMFSSHD